MFRINWTRSSRVLGALVAVGFLVSALTPLWNIAARNLAVSPQIDRADAVVVLASGVMADGSLTDESLRRALQGFALYKKGLADKIVLSGPPLGDGRVVESAARARVALDLGIPANAILQESAVHTTRDEASRIRLLFRDKQRPSVLLVTDSLHMRRAMRVFERAGFEVLPAPSDNYPSAARGPQDRIALMWRVLQEAGALVYYTLAGYI
jgi:uncharacterized SAM-binding protein YcdF (DUF218 family)